MLALLARPGSRGCGQELGVLRTPGAQWLGQALGGGRLRQQGSEDTRLRLPPLFPAGTRGSPGAARNDRGRAQAQGTLRLHLHGGPQCPAVEAGACGGGPAGGERVPVVAWTLGATQSWGTSALGHHGGRVARLSPPAAPLGPPPPLPPPAPELALLSPSPVLLAATAAAWCISRIKGTSCLSHTRLSRQGQPTRTPPARSAHRGPFPVLKPCPLRLPLVHGGQVMPRLPPGHAVPCGRRFPRTRAGWEPPPSFHEEGSRGAGQGKGQTPGSAAAKCAWCPRPQKAGKSSAGTVSTGKTRVTGASSPPAGLPRHCTRERAAEEGPGGPWHLCAGAGCKGWPPGDRPPRASPLALSLRWPSGAPCDRPPRPGLASFCPALGKFAAAGQRSSPGRVWLGRFGGGRGWVALGGHRSSPGPQPRASPGLCSRAGTVVGLGGTWRGGLALPADTPGHCLNPARRRVTPVTQSCPGAIRGRAESLSGCWDAPSSRGLRGRGGFQTAAWTPSGAWWRPRVDVRDGHPTSPGPWGFRRGLFLEEGLHCFQVWELLHPRDAGLSWATGAHPGSWPPLPRTDARAGRGPAVPLSRPAPTRARAAPQTCPPWTGTRTTVSPRGRSRSTTSPRTSGPCWRPGWPSSSSSRCVSPQV